jgi:hypothetical protein
MPTLDTDIGRMTYGLRANAKDVIDIWMMEPHRRPEFSAKEIYDIREAVYGLSALLQEISSRKVA